MERSVRVSLPNTGLSGERNWPATPRLRGLLTEPVSVPPTPRIICVQKCTHPAADSRPAESPGSIR